MDHDLVTMSQAKVRFIEHGHIRQLIADHAGIARALWRETLLDAAIDAVEQKPRAQWWPPAQ